LGESRSEGVGAGTTEDIDESTRVEDYLENPVLADPWLIALRLLPTPFRALPSLPTHHGEIGEDWASLGAAVDVPVIFFTDGA
jgi:hypothetical protein